MIRMTNRKPLNMNIEQQVYQYLFDMIKLIDSIPEYNKAMVGFHRRRLPDNTLLFSTIASGPRPGAKAIREGENAGRFYMRDMYTRTVKILLPNLSDTDSAYSTTILARFDSKHGDERVGRSATFEYQLLDRAFGCQSEDMIGEIVTFQTRGLLPVREETNKPFNWV